jgi:hypothetical protein
MYYVFCTLSDLYILLYLSFLSLMDSRFRSSRCCCLRQDLYSMHLRVVGQGYHSRVFC